MANKILLVFVVLNFLFLACGAVGYLRKEDLSPDALLAMRAS